MGTLLRVDPPGGCFASRDLDGDRRWRAQERLGHPRSPSTTRPLLPGQPEDDDPPRRRPSATQAIACTVGSSTGFPTPPCTFYVRIENEVHAASRGRQGTTTWTVARGQLGTTAATARHGRGTITALANDWYGGSAAWRRRRPNLKVTYKGKNCGTPPARRAPR